MSRSRPEWSTEAMSPPGAGSNRELQGDEPLSGPPRDPDRRIAQANRPQSPSQGQRLPEASYPYYGPREGEVVWPTGSMEPSQHPYMDSGPSRLPYDPGAFTFGHEGQTSSRPPPPPPQQQQQQARSQYPPIFSTFDRPFDSGPYHGMSSATPANPSADNMNPGYQYPSTSQYIRSESHYTLSHPGGSEQIPRSQHSQSLSYPYAPPGIHPEEASRAGRRHSSRLEQGSGEWTGPEYPQMGAQPDSSFRPFMPPNPPFYPGPFPDHPPHGSPGRHHPRDRSPSPHLSSTNSATSPQETGVSGGEKGRESIDMDDEEDWSHLPESERALAKLNKRRGQNKIAQRAFRKRTRMNKAQTGADLAQLTDLTQSQAKRLEDMTILVATLQRENAELRMAALNNQKPPATSAPRPALDTEQRSVPSDETIKGAGEDQDEDMERKQASPSEEKRQARPRESP